MRSTPGRCFLLKLTQRNTSISRTCRNVHHVTPKSRIPPKPGRAQVNENAVKKAKDEASDIQPAASASSKSGLLRRLLNDSRYKFYRRLILVSPALALAMLHLPYSIMTVNGTSMSPFFNLESHDSPPTTDRILVQRWSSTSSDRNQKVAGEVGAGNQSDTEFQRGQIVVFAAPHKPDRANVKRVVGIPGDLVHPLPGYPGGDEPVVVPWNHLWVEGDIGTWKDSRDSNHYGPISQNLVLGEAKAVLLSLFNWNWINWRENTWPARAQGRVEENAIMEATVDPDAVQYSSGWRDGSIDLVLERMRRYPDRMITTFVTDPKKRQETRRLYNNALYVAGVAESEEERSLAKEISKEMENMYGREALVYGIRLQKKMRDRGELPTAENLRKGEKTTTDNAAVSAESWLKSQGWELQRDSNGEVKTLPSSTS